MSAADRTAYIVRSPTFPTVRPLSGHSFCRSPNTLLRSLYPLLYVGSGVASYFLSGAFPSAHYIIMAAAAGVSWFGLFPARSGHLASISSPVLLCSLCYLGTGFLLLLWNGPVVGRNGRTMPTYFE